MGMGLLFIKSMSVQLLTVTEQADTSSLDIRRSKIYFVPVFHAMQH
jgi:hypothetical protein